MSTSRVFAPLSEVAPIDLPRVGAKAFNCARLRQAGFRVPDGLVVFADARPGDLDALAEHSWFDEQPEGARFAVRSSGIGEDGAGESFAGVHETFLDVARSDVPDAVARCRASGQSRQAIEYRRAKGLGVAAIEIGVLVQRMVHPVAAGVAFSVNPVSSVETELVINSSWGLGEALVSGQVDPDEYVVRKDTLELAWRRIGEKGVGASAPSLSDAQVHELAILLIAIERHYGAPQDVEWCHDRSGFWIVQSRPVTTARASAGEIEWTRANVAEVMPDQTSPQVLAAYEDLLNKAERLYLGGLLAPEDRVGPMAKSFCGRLHFNLSQLRHVCRLSGVAPAVMLKSMGHAGPIEASDEVTPPLRLAPLGRLPDLARIAWRHLRVAAVIRRHTEATARQLARLDDQDLQNLSDREMWAVLDQWYAVAPSHMQTVLLLTGVTFHETRVQKACERAAFSYERLVYPQLAAGERSVSTQLVIDLVALAEAARTDPQVVDYLSGHPSSAFELGRLRTALRGTAFLAAFESFLAQYGHRGRYEYDWSLPRYQEDPTPLLMAVRAHLQSDWPSTEDQGEAGRERDAAAAWEAFENRLSAWQRLFVLPQVRRTVAQIKRYYVWRERVRSDMARLLAALRRWHLELAERFVARGWLDRRADYFLLRFDEIAAIVSGRHGPVPLRDVVADRLAERERNKNLQLPLLMRESQLASLIRAAGVSAGPADGDLQGQAVSGGVVEAEVVVVRDPGDFDRMRRGAILVAPATDPSWTPLFTLASGVIVEVGGVLSHASTIAREYGLPALANVKNATRVLKTGERVRLDADAGLVRRIAHANYERIGEPLRDSSAA